MQDRDIYDIINTCASVFSAIGTVGAVSLTMYMLYTKSRQGIKMSIEIGSVWTFRSGEQLFISNESCSDELKDIATEQEKFLLLTIRNTCETQINIESLYISCPGCKQSCMISATFTDPNYYTAHISPHTSHSFKIPYDLVSQNRYIERIEDIDNIKLYIQTTMGSTFSSFIPEELKQDIKRRNTTYSASPVVPPESPGWR